MGGLTRANLTNVSLTKIKCPNCRAKLHVGGGLSINISLLSLLGIIMMSDAYLLLARQIGFIIYGAVGVVSLVLVIILYELLVFNKDRLTVAESR